MQLHIVMHESFEAPAAIEVWAHRNKCALTYTRLYQGDTFPQHCDFDFLIVMGGPQSPVTTLEECAHFDVRQEILFLQTAIEQNKILLGVCLGAQLIGEALGATFDHSPHREIGVFDVALTAAGKRDPIFSTFPATFPVGHWHGDMPGLTADAEVLAASAGCPRQIVKYRPHIYGFQCHCEFTSAAIEGMIRHCAHELEAYKNLPYIQNAQQLRQNDYTSMNELLFRFLDGLTARSARQKHK